MTDKTKNYKDYVYEGVLIVTSILFAFGIEAGWQEYKESRLENMLLKSLQIDFSQNLSLLLFTTKEHNEFKLVNIKFLKYSKSNFQKKSIKINDEEWIKLVAWHTYDPVVGTLNSLLSSGQLSEISNAELRAELANWLDNVEDMKENEVEIKKITDQFASLSFQFMPYRSSAFRIGMKEMGRESYANPDYDGLFGSLEIENIVAGRTAELILMESEIEKVRQSTQRILELIDQELN